MKYLIRFGLLLLLISSVSPLLFSQERPFRKLPHEEKLKLPHEKLEEENNQSQTRVISNHYYIDGYEITEYLNQTWNGTAWVNSGRTAITHNMFGLQDEYLYQMWDGTVWVNQYISHYSYNSNNLLIEALSQEWDGAVWQNSYQEFYSYNSNNLRSEYIGQQWDGTAWVNNFRYTLIYNSNDDVTEHIYYNWDGVVWVNSFRYLYSYDSNNNNTMQIYQSWDGAMWQDNSRYLITYNSNNNYDNYIYQYWNGTAWENNSKYSYTYDSNNNITLFLSESWNGTAWVNSSRYSYTYDSNNNLTLNLYQQWNGTTSAWDNYSRNINTFQGDLQTQSRYQTWVSGAWQDQYFYLYIYDSTDLHLLIEFIFQTWDGTAWVNNSRTLYTWTKVTDVEDDFNLTNFKLFNNYPNPFNPSTTIKYSISQNSFVRLTIYNILGKEIKEIINGVKDAGIYEENFNASGLSSGVYFCRIEALTSDGKKNFISVMKMLLIK